MPKKYHASLLSKSYRCLFVITSFLIIAGCGQRGDLYLEPAKNPEKQISFMPENNALIVHEPSVIRIDLPILKGDSKTLISNDSKSWKSLVGNTKTLKYVVFSDGFDQAPPYDLFIGTFATKNKLVLQHKISSGFYLRFTNNGDIKQIPVFLQQVKDYLSQNKQYQFSKPAFMSVTDKQTILYIKTTE